MALTTCVVTEYYIKNSKDQEVLVMNLKCYEKSILLLVRVSVYEERLTFYSDFGSVCGYDNKKMELLLDASVKAYHGILITPTVVF